MSKFCINLAGIPIGIEAMFDSAKDFCKEYLTEQAPLFSVTVTQAEIEKMRERDRKQALTEGELPSIIPTATLKRWLLPMWCWIGS